MGVFVEDDSQDGERISQILEGFEFYWNSQPRMVSSNLRIVAKPDNLDRIAEYANKAYTEFVKPSHYQRMAAFLVLTTVCPCFSIQADGTVITDILRRRWFFARVNLFLLPVLFTLLEGPTPPVWPGFPPDFIVGQIIEFLSRIDVFDIVDSKDYSHQTKGLAKDIVCLSLIIQLWVERGTLTSETKSVDECLRITGLLGT